MSCNLQRNEINSKSVNTDVGTLMRTKLINTMNKSLHT